MNTEILACFPQWANYAPAFKYLCEKGFDVKYLMPPPITRRTLELGSKYSPDYVCVPFKYCLGCYLEVLEKGANCLMQIFGNCRLNFYGELAERILRDMGYDFAFFNMADIDFTSPRSIFEHFRIINPKMTLVHVLPAWRTTYRMIEMIDEFEDYLRRNVGFEINEGELDGVYREFLKKCEEVPSHKELKKIYKEYRERLHAVKTNKPARTVKVGMIGDFYTAQEPFSNYFMEREFAKFGMEIFRSMNVSNTLVHNRYKDRLRYGKKYAKYYIGGTSNFSVAEALEFANAGVDGIIQVKSFGCTPEIDAIPILQNISRDYNIPILHFSFDSQTGEAGIKTRLEAFYDMVEARKHKDDKK